MYSFLRRIFFLFEPELAHSMAMRLFALLCSTALTRHWLRKWFSPGKPSVSSRCFGLDFPNFIGMGAGFDKNACYLRELQTLGFGFVEIGTVTPLPQPGNDKPRLFRLPASKALINRMGFNNDGVKAVADRLRRFREKHSGLIVGGNIGKNKLTPNDQAWQDYEKCFLGLFDCVDYFVVNVSSPNTPGLRELQEKDALHKILSHLQTINRQQPHPKPILLKIAPDLNTEQVNDVIDLALAIQLDGLVATNTTINREGLSGPSLELAEKAGPGGLSGAPLRQMSTDMVRYINRRAEGKIPIIASGGIFTADDAREKLEAGGCLLQVWTGFIYEGPSIVKKILNKL